MNRYIIIILGVVLLLLSGWMLFYQEPLSEGDEEDLDVVLADRYLCQDDSVLRARFINDNENVELTLPVGRTIRLQEVRASSGVRYESEDGLLVFRIEGEEASLVQGGEITHSGCRGIIEDTGEVNGVDEVVGKESVLQDSSWRWRETVYLDAEDVMPERPEEFVIIFDKTEGSVVALTDCNSMMGEYETDGEGGLRFSEMTSTLKYCEGSQEAEFSMMLSEVERFAIDEGDLVLFLSDGDGLFIFDPVERFEE